VSSPQALRRTEEANHLLVQAAGPVLEQLCQAIARSVENALTQGRPHSLLIRLNWPGRTLGDDTDGL